MCKVLYWFYKALVLIISRIFCFSSDVYVGLDVATTNSGINFFYNMGLIILIIDGNEKGYNNININDKLL